MYNVAPYVERCIRSLEDQDISKNYYEIICVNDGSTDNCREIIEDLQQEYPNIILINQENQGVSNARNNGIDRATGKYLLFIDPDDYVDARSFSRILTIADGNRAQVSFLGYTVLNVDGTIRIRVFHEKEKGKVVPGTEAYYLARINRRSDPDRMWAVLFEREFMNLHKLRFLPDVPYLEDGELIARVLCLAERCIFEGSSFYQRTKRPGSATNSNLFHTELAIKGFLKTAVNLKKFQGSKLLSGTQKVFLNRAIAKFAILTLISSYSLIGVIHIFKIRKELKSQGLIKLDLTGCDTVYTTFGKAFNRSLTYFFIYWQTRRFMNALINCKNDKIKYFLKRINLPSSSLNYLLVKEDINT